MVRNKVSNRVAMGVVGFMGLMVLQSLFMAKSNGLMNGSSGSGSSGSGMPLDPMSGISTSTMTSTTMTTSSRKELLEQYYNLGFQDATEGNPQGVSLQPALEELLEAEASSRVLQQQQHEQSSSDYLEDSDLPLSSSSSFGTDGTGGDKNSQFASITNAMSMFYLYRTIMELGQEQMTGMFSTAQLFANLNSIPIWRKGLLVLSVYRVLRIFI
jgi:hypothetical protein